MKRLALAAVFAVSLFPLSSAHGQAALPLSKSVDLTSNGVVFEEKVSIPWVWAPNYELTLTAQYEGKGQLAKELKNFPSPPFLPLALWQVLGVPDDARSAVDPRVGWIFGAPLWNGERMGLLVTITPIDETTKPFRFSAPVPGSGTQPSWQYSEQLTTRPLFINVDLSRFGPTSSVSNEVQEKDVLRLYGLERGGGYLIRVRNVASAKAVPGVKTSIVFRKSPLRFWN